MMGRGVLVASAACARHDHNNQNERDAGTRRSQLTLSSLPQPPAPQVLYLPDGGDRVINDAPGATPGVTVPIPEVARNLARRCPPEMVDVKGQFCIDRWEATLVDARTGRELSPYYPPDPKKARRLQEFWQNERHNIGSAKAKSIDLPELPDWHSSGKVEPLAMSKPGHIPSGYVDGNSAASACERAGKRLCAAGEWTTACRGETNRQFPYGERYEHGACNVFRESHPAAILHDDASSGHLDPRLNLVDGLSGPLLRPTGSTPRCASVWGKDSVFDMVGNLDEWVDDENGAFMGGFYARATRLGCDARISTHPKQYSDYSLGIRCCK